MYARRSTEEAAVEALLELSRALVGVAARSLAVTEDEITLPQYRALVALHVEGEQNVASLAESLGLHPSTVTRLCDRLLAKEFIERTVSPTNRREVRLRLSKGGRALVRIETERRRRAIGNIVARLDGKEQRDVVAVLGAVADAAEDAHGHAWKLGWTA
jgi:DNA-binding MarR family transcriptional regulator